MLLPPRGCTSSIHSQRTRARQWEQMDGHHLWCRQAAASQRSPLTLHISKQDGIISMSTKLRRPRRRHTWLGGTPPALLPAFPYPSGWKCFSFQQRRLQFPLARW